MDVTEVPDARTALVIGGATAVAVAVGAVRPDTPFVSGSPGVIAWGSLVFAASMVAAESAYATVGVGLLTVAAVAGFLANATSIAGFTTVAGGAFVAGLLVGVAGLGTE